MKNDTNEPHGRRAALRVIGGLGAVLLLDCGGTSPGNGEDGDAGGPGGGGTSGGNGNDGGTGVTADSSTGVTADSSTGVTTDASTGANPDSSTGHGGHDAAGADDAMSDVVTTTDSGVCVLDPSLTKGPYWIDEKLDRSDVTSDTKGKANPNPKPGVPLTLKFSVFAYSAGACKVLSGAQVDIWHCDGTGLYSDVANMGGADATGQNFLRGYQTSDASGQVTFQTIYPGWYTGRAVHIHVKVRIFDAQSNTTTEATTQVFFDDATSDTVFAAAAPYNARGARDTRNAADGIYGGHTELLLALKGSAAAGYTGTVSLGVQVGTIFTG